MKDTFKHKGLRKQLVDELRLKGIINEKVLAAINKVPRHLFIEDTAFENFAYKDIPFPIGCNQTISQPYTVAFQSDLLDVQKDDLILEIGTGCGYQTAVLLELGAKIYSIERQKGLFTKTSKTLPKLGYKAKLFFGDGYKGLPEIAPFNKIIVTAGAPFIPEDLLKQLTVGGYLIIPVGEGNKQIMTKITRVSETKYKKQEFGNFSFVPLLKDKNW